MGRRGPVPEDDDSKKARGNPGKRPLKNLSENISPFPGADLPAELPAIPDRVLRDPVALATWNKYAPLCAQMGSLTQLDELSFAELCICVSRHVKLTAIIESGKGTSIKSKNSRYHVTTDEAKQLKAVWEKLLKLLAQFGLTAESRKRNGWKAPRVLSDKEAAERAELNALLHGHRS